MRTAILVLALILAAAAAPAATAADGFPLPVEDAGPAGVAAPGGNSRLLAVRVGRDTLVERTSRNGGQIEDTLVLRGNFTVPTVALDATAAGLSHDTSTLVLIRPRDRFPRPRTTLVILDAPGLRVRRTVTLRGDFSFDAVSPDGATVYLIQYVDPGDPTNYLVRSLKSATGRLDRDPIVDPNERGDEMRGFALTRATSPDGRREYTLYDGMGKHPFIHALDTVGRGARCIDLPPALANTAMNGLRLVVAPGGERVDVVDRLGHRGTVARVDTSTFAVTDPGRRSAARTQRADEAGSIAWPSAVAAGLLLSGVAVMVRRRTRAP